MLAHHFAAVLENYRWFAAVMPVHFWATSSVPKHCRTAKSEIYLVLLIRLAMVFVYLMCFEQRSTQRRHLFLNSWSSFGFCRWFSFSLLTVLSRADKAFVWSVITLDVAQVNHQLLMDWRKVMFECLAFIKVHWLQLVVSVLVCRVIEVFILVFQGRKTFMDFTAVEVLGFCGFFGQRCGVSMTVLRILTDAVRLDWLSNHCVLDGVLPEWGSFRHLDKWLHGFLSR